MDAVTAFSHRRDALCAQLQEAGDMQQAVLACSMALEQTACELAQDEQDEHARQRQQAVLAVARRAPELLRAARAEGELVVPQGREGPSGKGAKALCLAGLAVLLAVAAYAWMKGRGVEAMLQAAGVLAFAAGGLGLSGGLRGGDAAPRVEARGIPRADAQALVMQLSGLCEAVDICVSDLALLDAPGGQARLCGTADDAMLDLLVALMEARSSGRDEMAMHSLSLAEEYLRMLGIEVVAFTPESAAMFDRLPTVGAARTVRPALVKDGRVLRRGVAACPQGGQAAEGGGRA